MRRPPSVWSRGRPRRIAWKSCARIAKAWESANTAASGINIDRHENQTLPPDARTRFPGRSPAPAAAGRGSEPVQAARRAQRRAVLEAARAGRAGEDEGPLRSAVRAERRIAGSE